MKKILRGCEFPRKEKKQTESVSWSLPAKCDKENINGTICGKPYGTCIHTWITTRMGAN